MTPYWPDVMTFVDELLAGGGWIVAGHAQSLIVLERTGQPAGAGEAEGGQEANASAAGQPPSAAAAAVEGPLVTCLMATADRHALVPQAIAYFLRQDYPNRELIILDDGTEPLADIVPDDPRLRLVRLDRRRSMGAKHNLGCELSRGEIIVHWDDDDWVAPWRLGYQVGELLERGGGTGGPAATGLANLYHLDPAAGLAWRYVYPAGWRPWVSGCSLCYHKAVWRRFPFKDMSCGADTDWAWRLPEDTIRPHAAGDRPFIVAMVHARNTSPKRTKGQGWVRVPAAEIFELMTEEDRGFYAGWRPAAPGQPAFPW